MVDRIITTQIIRLAPLFLIAAVFAVPLFYVKFPLTVVNIDKSFAFYLLTEVALLISIFAYHAWIKLRPNLIDGLVIIFLLAATASTIWSSNASDSFWGSVSHVHGLLLFLHLTAFYFLLRVLVHNGWWQIIWRVIAITAGLVGLYALIQTWGIDSTLLPMMGERAPATLGNPVLLGSYLSLTLIITLVLLLRKESLIVYGTSLILQLAGLLASGSRGALIALLVGLIWLLWPLFKNWIRAKKFWTTAGIVAIVLIVVVSFTPAKRIFTDLSLNPSRVLSWQLGLNAFTQKPIFGWGLDNYEIVFEKAYQPVFEPYILKPLWFDSAHNFIVQLLATMGIIGLLAYLLLVLIPAFFALKPRSPSHLMIRAAGLILIINLIQNLFNFDSISTYILTFTAIAFIAAQTHIMPWQLKRAGAALLAVLGIGAVVGLFIFPPKILAYYQVASASALINQGELRTAQSRLASAHNIPFRNGVWNFLTDNIYNYSLYAETGLSADDKLAAYDLINFLSENLTEPTSRQNYSLARLHFPMALYGAPDAVENMDKFYLAAIEQIPNGAFLYASWAVDSMRLSLHAKARTLYARAIELSPDYIMAHFWSALNEIYDHQFDSAQQQFSRFWEVSDKYNIFHGRAVNDIFRASESVGRRDLFEQFYAESQTRRPEIKLIQ